MHTADGLVIAVEIPSERIGLLVTDGHPVAAGKIHGLHELEVFPGVQIPGIDHRGKRPQIFRRRELDRILLAVPAKGLEVVVPARHLEGRNTRRDMDRNAQLIFGATLSLELIQGVIARSGLDEGQKRIAFRNAYRSGPFDRTAVETARQKRRSRDSVRQIIRHAEQRKDKVVDHLRRVGLLRHGNPTRQFVGHGLQDNESRPVLTRRVAQHLERHGSNTRPALLIQYEPVQRRVVLIGYGRGDRPLPVAENLNLRLGDTLEIERQTRLPIPPDRALQASA